jgi:hypothetical protein
MNGIAINLKLVESIVPLPRVLPSSGSLTPAPRENGTMLDSFSGRRTLL